jgi:CBS domain-containing protein
MTLGELLTPSRVLLPLHAESVEGAGEALREAAFRPGVAENDRAGEPDPPARPPVIRALGEAALLILEESAPRDAAALGIAPVPIPWPEGVGGDDASPGPRIVLFVARSAGSRIGTDGLQRVEGRLARPELVQGLLRAATPEAVLGVAPLMGVHLTPPLQVADALVPMAYRVYPDTPVAEVLDLMARKNVNALPVVGESLQVVGILTAGDGLRLLLNREDKHALVARDIMTRTVLCVTEEQELEEAARIMVNRNLRQLPVVRDGEMVGFLHRESVLATLLRGKQPRKQSGRTEGGV